MTDPTTRADVERLSPYAVDGGCDAYGQMEDDPFGDYVTYEAYQALVAERAAAIQRAEAAEAERRAMHRRAQIAEGRLYRMTEYLNLWRDSRPKEYWFRRHIENALRGCRKDSGSWRSLLYDFWRKELDAAEAALTEALAQAAAAFEAGRDAAHKAAFKIADEMCRSRDYAAGGAFDVADKIAALTPPPDHAAALTARLDAERLDALDDAATYHGRFLMTSTSLPVEVIVASEADMRALRRRPA